MATISIEPQETLSKALFDRATLQFSVQLIRPHNPSLALRIQNLIAPTANVYKQFGSEPGPDDLFKLTLDSFTLKRVVDTLAVAGQELAENVLQTLDGDHEHLLTTKAVIGKWLSYALHHQAQYEKLQQQQS
jgi:hypothetical protein